MAWIFGGVTAALLVVIAALVVVVATGSGDDGPQSDRSVANPVVSPSTTTSVMVEAGAVQATTPSTSPPTEPPAVPLTAPPTTPAVVSGGDSARMDTWAVVLGSLPSQADAERRRGDLGSLAPDAKILNSNDVATLKSGWWVVYEDGFASGDAALGECARMGFATSDDCYAAYISMDGSKEQRLYP